MKKLLTILIFLPVFAHAQSITTVLGPSSTLNCGGWGSCIAVDHSGNYFISQECDNSVYKVTPSGVVTRIAGTGAYAYSGDGGPATAAALYEPMGVAVDNIGNVYIADMSNERIRKVDLSGIITTVAGIGSSTPTVGGFSGDGGQATDAELNQPAGVSVDNIGNIYIADANNGRIRKVDIYGTITTVVGGGATLGDGGFPTAAQLYRPTAVAFDYADNMYICDNFSGNRIRKVSSLGIISTIAGTGVAGYNGDGIAGTAAQVNIPRGIAVDGAGNVYIADINESRIRKVDAITGIITTVAGNGLRGFSGDGGLATAAMINSGNIAIDNSGDLIITDFGNSRIRKVNMSVLNVDNLEGMESVTLYPNPAQKTLSISSPGRISRVSIINVIGRIVTSHDFDAEKVQVDISNLPTGIYVAKINNSVVRKFVKE
jgi:sugar lactone lactonase YvrE